ncbi:thioredoxin family protein [Kordia sp. YSTF-M3]|uniref:Thioredoxin family protein n=1 Tax=Kordia aestuariivivens TaxID=2759037 RepID=A0ABR7Q4P5_9FLAO|nr:thioredoxin family protein [Kordia aestuariivivens]MBC8753483.1 thioredoxin family protein [Kordia aestuariivivens]
MKKLLYIVVALSFFACKNEKKEIKIPTTETTATTEQTDSIASEEEEKLPILTGIQTRASISAAPYDSWFSPTYATYPADKVTLDKVKPLLADVNVKIFMGTWCEDSQREVPHFYKLLDIMKVDDKSLELITVDEEKVTPEHLEDGFNITNVPTFIFYRDGKEINRIVESPIVSLEEDMLSILSGKEYKHSYAE